jgi:hypothetical protein
VDEIKYRESRVAGCWETRWSINWCCFWAADLVRYDTDGKQVRYWLKHKRDTSKLLKALETIVHSSSKLT